MVLTLWLCPGTWWLLSHRLTNRELLQQISLLPIPVDIMSADLQAAGGPCVRASVFMHVCGFMIAQREGGGENAQGVRDLLITLCSVSPPLPPLLLPYSIFPGLLHFPFSTSLFIEGCRGHVFSALQCLTDFEWPAFYKNIIPEHQCEGRRTWSNKLFYKDGLALLILCKWALMSEQQHFGKC